jgi:hypothetical protein
MKLQKHPSRKSKDGENYFKWELIIPKEDVKNSGFKEGEDLKIESEKGEIRIKRKSN